VGRRSFSGNRSDCFFHCLNSCGNPGQVPTVDHDVHAIKLRIWVGVAADFISLSDGAEGAQGSL
jgi:hypothetical protein